MLNAAVVAMGGDRCCARINSKVGAVHLSSYIPIPSYNHNTDEQLHIPGSTQPTLGTLRTNYLLSKMPEALWITFSCKFLDLWPWILYR